MIDNQIRIQKHLQILLQDTSPLPDMTNLSSFLFFIGFDRSGHSFIGQIINAHPDALVGNEGQFLHVLKDRLTLENAYRYMNMLDSRFAKRKYCKKNGQDFYFTGLYQGQIRNLKCLGNSKAAKTVGSIYRNRAILQVLENSFPELIKFVLVVRNPKDLVGSKMKRKGFDFQRAFKIQQGACNRLGDVLSVVKAKFEVLEIVYEEFIENLTGGIEELFSFLSLDIPEGFVEAVQSKTYKAPEKSRVIFNDIAGAEKLLDVHISKYSFFKPYRK